MTPAAVGLKAGVGAPGYRGIRRIWVCDSSGDGYSCLHMAKHGHLRRLDRVWVPGAVYFITACTQGRRPVLARPAVHEVLRREWESAQERHGWRIGRYVIMPDHVHFFCAERPEGADHELSRFMGSWKEWTAKNLRESMEGEGPLWQEEFFDHVLRSDESYGEKWAYVRENPVRAGWVATWEAWPYQGFVDFDCPKGG